MSENITPSSNTSDLSGGNSFADLINAIGGNIQNYENISQVSSQEQQAEQNLIAAVQNAQNFQTNLTAGQMAQYGVGRPIALSTGRAQQLAFNSQIAQQNVLNAENLAGTQLGLAQQNRQINSQAALGGVNALLSAAGLVKPTPLSPGSSLVNPATGQAVYAGSGLYPASVGDVASLATQLVSTGQFQDYASAYSYAQNLLSTQFGSSTQTNPSTASSLGANSTGSTIPMQNGSTVMGYDMSTYATDPNYASELTSTISQIPNTVTTASSIQNYIDSVAKNSPVTGQMVYNAATQYGVDPRMLLGVMQHESGFGTQGEATTTYNPGNVGNTDSGKTVNYGNWQTGVNVLAQNLAGRYVGNNANSSAPQTTSMNQKQTIQSVFQQYPQIYPALNFLSDGTPYIDSSKVPQASQVLANQLSTETGIQILGSDEVGKARSIDVVTQNIGNINNLMSSVLGSGIGGKVGNTLATWWNDITGTNTGITAINNYRTNAIGAIEALAAGTGTGFRLNQTEVNNAVSSLPTSTDTLEQAQAKIATMQSYLNEWHNELFPNNQIQSNPTQLTGGSAITGSGSSSAAQDYINSLIISIP